MLNLELNPVIFGGFAAAASVKESPQLDRFNGMRNSSMRFAYLMIVHCRSVFWVSNRWDWVTSFQMTQFS
jgi:hypothetical protein